MVEAKTAGVNEAASYMVESSILKDRGEKQLEAQNMLTQALASLSKSKMRGMVVQDRLHACIADVAADVEPHDDPQGGHVNIIPSSLEQDRFPASCGG